MRTTLRRPITAAAVAAAPAPTACSQHTTGATATVRGEPASRSPHARDVAGMRIEH